LLVLIFVPTFWYAENTFLSPRSAITAKLLF
jgi:hypothetical protein